MPNPNFLKMFKSNSNNINNKNIGDYPEEDDNEVAKDELDDFDFDNEDEEIVNLNEPLNLDLNDDIISLDDELDNINIDSDDNVNNSLSQVDLIENEEKLNDNLESKTNFENAEKIEKENKEKPKRRGRKPASEIAKQEEAAKNNKENKKQVIEKNEIKNNEEIFQNIMNYVCKQTISNLKENYISKMYTKEYSELLFNGYLEDNIKNTPLEPLFKALILECIENNVEDSYLKEETISVLSFIERS